MVSRRNAPVRSISAMTCRAEPRKSRPGTSPAKMRMGSCAWSWPMMSWMSRARGPRVTKRRPCAPMAVQGSCDQGLPERSGSQGIIESGKMSRLRRSARTEAVRMKRRHTTRSLKAMTLAPRTPAARGQAAQRGRNLCARRLSFVVAACAASPRMRRTP